MAVQAHLYLENLGFLPNPNPLNGLPDFMVTSNPVSVSSGLEESAAMPLSQAVSAHLQWQRQELDCILQLQNERLRSALQQQKQHQLLVLLKSVESKALSLLRQKEENLVKATKKSLELETHLRKTQMESDYWQRLARQNDAVAMDLRNSLQQITERMEFMSKNSSTEDAESICCGNNSSEKEENKMGFCKNCNVRSPCVLLLPCRHLCSCKSCEPFLGSCPVCKSAKEASMEILWA